MIAKLAAYGVLSVRLILFFLKGPTWRESADESMKHRSLRGSEIMMLCLAILFFMAIIREESGTHFDPAVVEAFFLQWRKSLKK